MVWNIGAWSGLLSIYSYHNSYNPFQQTQAIISNATEHNLLSTSNVSLELKKKIGKEYLDALVGGDRAKIAALSEENLIQHNPTVPTGSAALIAFAPTLKQSGITLTTHRIVVEGDLVALHNEYQNADLFGAPELVTFDIFRITNGIIAEHWDNLQLIVSKDQTKSGRSMLNGPMEIMDFENDGGE